MIICVELAIYHVLINEKKWIRCGALFVRTATAFAVWLFRSCFADFHHLVLAQQFSRHHYALHLIKINLIKSSSQLTLGFSRVGSMKSIQNHMINSFIHRNKATKTHTWHQERITLRWKYQWLTVWVKVSHQVSYLHHFIYFPEI